MAISGNRTPPNQEYKLIGKEENAEKCLSILEGMSDKAGQSCVTEFVGAQSEIFNYLPLVLSGVSIELHIKLHRKTETYHLQVAEIWRNTLSAIIYGAQVQFLGLNDLLIHICLHLDKHFREMKVQFTCFNDVSNILERNDGRID